MFNSRANQYAKRFAPLEALEKIGVPIEQYLPQRKWMEAERFKNLSKNFEKMLINIEDTDTVEVMLCAHNLPFVITLKGNGKSSHFTLKSSCCNSASHIGSFPQNNVVDIS